ncbi:MAG: hypothetical protein J6T82_00120 [Bacteroidaceae bacterium]|nr:hypothetical protein [Bacteroidaceae bacterium]
MEKRIEKWESLRLGTQKFAAQEFVAACEAVISYTWDGTHAFPSNTKFYEDVGIIGSLDSADYGHACQTFNYGSLYTIEDISVLIGYYWASDNNVASEIHTDLQNGSTAVYESYRTATPPRAGKVVGFSKNGSGNQVIAGTIVESSVKNNS